MKKHHAFLIIIIIQIFIKKYGNLQVHLNQKIFIYMEIVVFHIILEAPHYLKKKIRNKFIF